MNCSNAFASSIHCANYLLDFRSSGAAKRLYSAELLLLLVLEGLQILFMADMKAVRTVDFLPVVWWSMVLIADELLSHYR